MNPLIIRDVAIGEGIPKICVSLTSKTKAELLVDAQAIVGEMDSNGDVVGSIIDLVEWRVDHYEEIDDNDKILFDVLEDLRHILGDKPLIFTYRSAGEGGAGRIERLIDERLCYASYLKTAIDSGLIDMVDIELFQGDEAVTQLIDYAHAHDVKVIVSNHDFNSTPKLEELMTRLKKMQDLGADILKIAVMPSDMKDVLTLLEATVNMSEKYADRPIVTIAMSERGGISRVTGEIFGSSITFGTLGKSSAPGQIEASELSKVLIRMHNLFSNFLI